MIDVVVLCTHKHGMIKFVIRSTYRETKFSFYLRRKKNMFLLDYL